MDPGRITLALGPTNTGKTHRAIQHMLEHETGMIGLPLRLLAREVYDRVTRKVGEREVALITGEEKRLPPSPRYWIATVEAMPTDVEVDFLAVDEIQLAAHRERGHVFTDRLLHSRGRLETLFLGADTIAPLARELLPEAALRRQPRLSTLRHSGRSGLGGLPARSAVVAFSADEVYAIAARLRARRGGAAVVLGALSPRTRNAQVALYQAGEVQYLVATDAIGMGLNLDVDHVAFAATAKFDGRSRRFLRPDELAQIAGRAGRHRRDGTFGTLNPLPQLDERTVRAIEEHRFPPLRRLVWRNPDLDFTSVDALMASLARAPERPHLVRVEQADDFDALRTLAARPEIRALAKGEARVALLFEVCQVPDYRKLMLLRHAQLLAEIYQQLVDRGRLDPEFVRAHVDRIDRIDGELDTLTARLSAIRVFTYVSHRGDWLDDPVGWQERTRHIEDRLGDALHERLVERFVERTNAGATAAARRALPEVDADNPFAALRGMLEATQTQSASEAERFVEDLVSAPHGAFDVDDDGTIHLSGGRVGRLVSGQALDAPVARAGSELGLRPGARSRVDRRLAALARDFVSELLAPLRTIDDPQAPERGILYQLERHLGTIDRRQAREQIEALDERGLARMQAAGIRFGRRAVYSTPMFEAESLRRRALLVRLYYGAGKRPARASYAAGLLRVGGRLLRADLVEDALELLRGQSPPFDLPDAVAELLGALEEARPVLSALGYGVRDDGKLEPKRRRRRRR